MILYLDMDGVLMDFERRCRDFSCDWRGPVYHHKPQEEWTEEQAANDRRYKEAMALPEFWHGMIPLPDANLLWGWAARHDPRVLTATPAAAAYRARCANDKLASIRRFFDPDFRADRFFAVLRSEKAAFAHSQAVLVDDMLANCEEWVAAGGIAVHHKDALSTIRVLREIYGE